MTRKKGSPSIILLIGGDPFFRVIADPLVHVHFVSYREATAQSTS
jgi:hypothetical protein